MKKLTIAIIAILLGIFPSLAAGTATGAKKDFKDETLNYVITYKWGLVHKEAGTATLSLRDRGTTYDLKLTGRTKPWADKVFQVRDTLYSQVSKQEFRPLRYVKAAHEGGKYSLDDIRYTYAGSVVKGDVSKRREKKGKITSSKAQLMASDAAYDMLSVFYYLRTIDYSSLDKGKTVKTSIFSGSKKETVSIKSLGVEEVKLKDGTKRNGYHIRFNFTSDNGKKSSDDIDAWLSYDEDRIPLVLIGKLPIGSVRCYLTK